MNNEPSTFLSLSPSFSWTRFLFPSCWCDSFKASGFFSLDGWKWWSQIGPCFWVAAACSVVLKYSKRYFAVSDPSIKPDILEFSGVWRGCFVLFACCRFWDGSFVKRLQCGSFKFDSAAMCSAVEMNMVTLQ
jgi:hypothetical protein